MTAVVENIEAYRYNTSTIKLGDDHEIRITVTNSKGLSGRVDDKILSRAARRQEAKLLSKTSPSITLPSYGGDAVDKFFTFVGTKLGHTPELPHYPSGNYGVVDLAKLYNKVRKFWEDGFNAASRGHVDPFNNTATFTYPTVYKTAPDWK